MKCTTCCFFVVLLLISASGAGAGTISVVHGDKYNPLVEVVKLVMSDVYARLGYEVEYVPRPLRRAATEADEGTYDAEVARVEGVEAQYPHLIRVPVPIYTIKGVVFSKHKDFTVRDWESLRPYRIGFLRGVHFAERGTKGMHRNCANSLLALFRMLDMGRVDVIVEARLNGMITLRQLGLEDSVRILKPPLRTMDLFHYVHEKNEYLIIKMSELLTQMKNDGSLSELVQRSEQAVLQAIPDAGDSDGGKPCPDRPD